MRDEMVNAVAGVVAAYVSNHKTDISEIPELVRAVTISLANGGPPIPEAEPAKEINPQLTAAQIRKSISPSYLVCFDDGKKLKILRRHLGRLGMTPEQYRAKWGLPHDYPMVAPEYAKLRSEMAKTAGLGLKKT